MHQPESTDDDKQCDKLESAMESASNLHLLWVSVVGGCVSVLGCCHRNSGFLTNIENAFCFVCC